MSITSRIRTHSLLVSLFILSSATAAYAHAHVESSVPKAGEILAQAPESVSITFSEEVRPKESFIKVYAGKKQISSAEAAISADNKTLTEALPKLDSGSYTVKWKAVCLCTDHHATNGSFTFEVK